MKKILITEEDKRQIMEDVKKALETARLADGSFSFTRSFAARPAGPEERAMLWYTPEAYIKMQMLVKNNDKEVGWHGLIKRLDDRSWIVYDVLVYDQEVTGATVNTVYEGENGYPAFLARLTDEQSENLFFHGHSHVNMGVQPSTVDMEHRHNMMATSDGKHPWVFQIWNKRGDINTTIYDIENNIMYEPNDIDLNVTFAYGGTGDTHDAYGFIEDAKKRVKTREFVVIKNDKPDTNKKTDQKKRQRDRYGYVDDPVDDGMSPYGRCDYGYYN